MFVIPALIPLIIFWIYPIFRSLFISFTDWDYMSPTYNFVFLDNFKSLFTDERFYEALWNTILFIQVYPVLAVGDADCSHLYRMDLDF